MSCQVIENLCIEIHKPNLKPFLTTRWYRLPNSIVDKFNYFESLLGKLDAEQFEYYVMGDLNCNLGSPTLDHNSTLLKTIANLYNLHQLINPPRHIAESSSTLLDVMYKHAQ